MRDAPRGTVGVNLSCHNPGGVCTSLSLGCCDGVCVSVDPLCHASTMLAPNVAGRSITRLHDRRGFGSTCMMGTDVNGG